MSTIDEGTRPPPVLRLAWLCGTYHLPDDGGVYDQDYETYSRMIAANNVYNVMSKLRNSMGDQIHSLTMEDRKILKRIRDMGLLYG